MDIKIPTHFPELIQPFYTGAKKVKTLYLANKKCAVDMKSCQLC